MNNFDKVKEELALQDIQKYNTAQFTLCSVIHKVKNERGCTDRSCSECVKWLAEEYVEPIVLSEAERTILENVDKEYKYIARDKDGKISFFTDRPYKIVGDYWGNTNKTGRIIFNNLFQFIKWEDTEPYNIAELLEG